MEARDGGKIMRRAFSRRTTLLDAVECIGFASDDERHPGVFGVTPAFCHVHIDTLFDGHRRYQHRRGLRVSMSVTGSVLQVLRASMRTFRTMEHVNREPYLECSDCN